MLHIKLALMAVFWSGVFPAVNIVLKSMGEISSVFLRFSAAAVILLALLWLREGRLRRLSPRESVLVVVLGLFGITLYNSLFTAGLARVEASRASLIVPTNPAFTALFAVLFLRERLSAARAAGIALCVAGALWVLARGEPRTLLGRVALSSLSPLALTAYVMAAGALPTAIPAWFENEAFARVTWQSWAALGYLVVFGTVIPFLWFYEGVKALGAARASQFINLVPPLAVTASILILGEAFTPALLVGAALVIAGLYLTNKPK